MKQLNGMPDPLYDSGAVRRTNFRLQTEFYGLETAIYQIGRHHYAIRILNCLDRYEAIRAIFDHEIRPAAEWIELLDREPEEYLCTLEPLQHAAYHQEGIFLNLQMFKDLLVSRFPDIDFTDLEVQHGDGIKLMVSVAGEITQSRREEVTDFISQMREPYTEIEIRGGEKKKVLYNDDVGAACTDKSRQYSVRDAELWFDSAERIYGGTFRREELPFYKEGTSKCYMDFSLWDNINLRNSLLLYDQVYISFPLGSYLDDFLHRQNLKMKDLEELVQRDKLVLLLPNTESRYDTERISRLYQIEPSAVVSKRGINTLMAQYFCELERQYLASWGEGQELLKEVCLYCRLSDDENMKTLLEWLRWPIKAKRESFELLNSYGPVKLPGIGVNRLFDRFDRQGGDMHFELTVNSNSIHIASALQATYYPFYKEGEKGNYSDRAVAMMLGAVLNQYEHPTPRNRETIDGYTQRMQRENHAIRLLNADEYVDVRHFLDYAEKYKTADGLKKIVTDLTELPEESQKQKISEYNNLIAEIGKEKINPFQKAAEYVLSGAGFIPAVGIGASVLSLLMQISREFEGIRKAGDLKKIKKMGKCSEEDAENIYLLDRISRVAKLKY